MDDKEKNRDTDRFVAEVVGRVFGSKDHELHQDAGSAYWSSRPQLHIDRVSLKSLFYNEDWVFILNNLVATKISNRGPTSKR